MSPNLFPSILLESQNAANEQETESITNELYQKYFAKHDSLILLLEASLGAGKTYFARALAKSLGIHENVNSPTFNLLHIYSNENYELCHYDLYRLHDPSELEQLDFVERWSHPSPSNKRLIHVIEWPQLAKDFLPSQVTTYRLTIEWPSDMLEESNRRQIQLYYR